MICVSTLGVENFIKSHKFLEIKLRRPRVRDLQERFESRVLPLFAKRTREVRDLNQNSICMVWQGDFDGLILGEEAVPQHRSEGEVAGRNGGLAEPTAVGWGGRSNPVRKGR